MSDETTEVSRVRVVKPRWDGAILVCGKCLKRHPDGKALRQGLKAEVKARAKASMTGRKARIVKVACVKLCPKHAVVVASGATLSTGDVMLVRGVDDIAEAFPRLVPRDPA